MEIQESFAAWPALERLDAVKDSPGWKGCNKSHIKALTLAKERKLPWVLVLEDDCDPEDDALTRFTALLPTLWAKRGDWDVFLGGCTSVKDVTMVQNSPPLLNVKGYTTHFCLYNQNSYDKLIQGIQANDVVIDSYFRESPDIRCFCTVPHLATQKPSKSDLQNEHTNYETNFKVSNAELLKQSNIMLEGFVSEIRIFKNKIVVTDILLLLTLAALYRLVH